MVAPLDPSRPDRAAGGGPGGEWRARVQLSVPDLAWEFLRRNSDYRVEFQKVARDPAIIDPRWGLRFGADPSLEAPGAPVFWRSDAAPALVVPFVEDRRPSLHEARSWQPRGDTRLAEEGLHVRLPEGLQLQYLGDAKPGGPLLVMLAFDGDFGLRVRAVERFNRAVAGLAAPASRLTRAQRERLAKSLVALDGFLGGDSYRAIATMIFGREAVEREVWRISSVRAVTIRLVDAGRRLMAGGYLKLLKEGL